MLWVGSIIIFLKHQIQFDNPWKACGRTEKSFHHGITNGADWYPLSGGMEDFNYLYGDCFEITIEITCCKYPYAKELESEWNRNKGQN